MVVLPTILTPSIKAGSNLARIVISLCLLATELDIEWNLPAEGGPSLVGSVIGPTRRRPGCE